MRSRALTVAASVSLALLANACGPSSSSKPAGAGAAYSVALTVSAASALPKCTASLSGTVAYASSPPSLWECSGQRWHGIACTNQNAGAVAYAAGTQLLLACVSGNWTQVAIPEGPPGPQGPAGATGPQGTPGENSLALVNQEPPGANCALGGLRLDTGLDTNGDGALESTEIQHTAYVCAVSAGVGGAASGGADGGAGTAGGAIGDAGTQCASVVDVWISPDTPPPAAKVVVLYAVDPHGLPWFGVDWHLGGSSVGIVETDPATMDAIFVCTSVGTQTVELTVTSGDSTRTCSSSLSTTVDCTTLCGNGTVDPGEACDPPDGLTCDAACKLVSHDGGAAGNGGAAGGAGGTTDSGTLGQQDAGTDASIGPDGGAGAGQTCGHPSSGAGWDQVPTFKSPGVVAALWANGSDLWAATVHQYYSLDDRTLFRSVTVDYWDGSAWNTLLSQQMSGDPKALWASGKNDVWLATAAGLIHWDGSTWTDRTPFSAGGNYMVSVWGLGPNDVWTMRGGGGLGVFHWDGQTWADRSSLPRVPAPSDAPPDVGTSGIVLPGPVWGATSGDVWMLGAIEYPLWPAGPNAFAGGTDLVGYAHWDVDHWTVLAPATMADARPGDGVDIAGSSATDIWAVGQAPGFAEHYDGHVWTRSIQLDYPSGFGIVSVSCPGDVWATGLQQAPGAIYHYDGNTWSPASPSFLTSFSLVSAMTAAPTGDVWIGSDIPYYYGSANEGAGYIYHFRP